MISTMDTNEELLTQEQLADELGIQVSTLRRWRGEGTGPKPVRLTYHLVRYRRADVNAWISERANAA